MVDLTKEMYAVFLQSLGQYQVMVSSKKAECGVGFLGNIGDVCCPFKIIRYSVLARI